jgi:hypothetical protein
MVSPLLEPPGVAAVNEHGRSLGGRRTGLLVAGALLVGGALAVTVAFRSTLKADREGAEGRATIVSSTASR